MNDESYFGQLTARIVFYLLGGAVGVALGTILRSFHFPFFETLSPLILYCLTALVGAIIAIFIFDYKKEKEFRINSKIRNETVALITHEMRTALTSTGWAIHLVLDNYSDKLSEGDKKTLNDVVSTIDTTVMHSVNLLDVSLLDIGKLAISLEYVTLKEVQTMFDEITAKYTYGAERKGIKLSAKSMLDHDRQVEVDMLRLRIVLENLLENALQYTLRDEKKIDVIMDNDANLLNITIRDTGIGIPFEEQERIFSQFFRASNARKKLSSGSGIGLYMSKKYVEAHRGRFRFESKENVGTTFYISIPLKTTANVNEFLEKI